MDASFYRAQMSDELRALFDELAELTEIDSRSATPGQSSPKYGKITLHRLIKTILFRSHGTQMNALCLLMVAAIQADRGRGYFDFLWRAGVGRRDCCASYFLRALPSQPEDGRSMVTASTEGIVLHFADRSSGVRTLEYKFVPLVACLLDFLVRSLGLQALNEFREQLTKDDLDRRRLDEVANAITRALYAWLDPHLPSKYKQGMFRTIANHFSEQLGASFTIDDIDDNCIFGLWASVASTGAEDRKSKTPRKFKPVFGACLRFMDLLAAAADLQNGEATLSILQDGEQPTAGGGQIRADGLENDRQEPMFDDQEVPFTQLRFEPDTVTTEFAQVPSSDAEKLLQLLSETNVNVLNDYHLEKLFVIGVWTQWIERFPLSYLRSEAFGSIARPRGGSWSKLFERNQYQRVRDDLNAMGSQIDEALAACFFLRLRNRDQGVGTGGDTADFTLARGKAVLRKKRRGFQEALKGDPQAVEAFLSLEEALLQLKCRLDRVRKAIGPDLSADSTFQQDRDRFAAQLQLTHGSE